MTDDALGKECRCVVTALGPARMPSVGLAAEHVARRARHAAGSWLVDFAAPLGCGPAPLTACTAAERVLKLGLIRAGPVRRGESPVAQWTQLRSLGHRSVLVAHGHHHSLVRWWTIICCCCCRMPAATAGTTVIVGDRLNPAPLCVLACVPVA